MQPTTPSGNDRQLAAGAVRGIILLAVAVIVGVFLLRASFDFGGGTVAADGDIPDITEVDDTTDTTAEGTTDTTAEGTTDTTTGTTVVQPKPPNEVRALVANGSGVQGAAGRTGDALSALGYTVVGATNAEAPVQTTSIYFGQGFNADALAIAEALGAPEGSVSLMPNPPPVADLQGADVLVVLGPDLATAS